MYKVLFNFFYSKTLCSVLVFMSLSFSLQANQKTMSPPQRTLALNWKAEPQFGGFFEAKYENVTIQEGGSGTPTIQMVQNSKVDYGLISGEEILLAKDRQLEKNPLNSVTDRKSVV